MADSDPTTPHGTFTTENPEHPMADPAVAVAFADPPSTAIEWVQIIVDTSGETRRRHIEDFHRWAQPTIRSITSRILLDMRLDRNTWADEVESWTAEAMFKLLMEVVDGSLAVESLYSFRQLLAYRAKSLTTAEMNTTRGMNQASGQVGMKRRIKEMRWTLNHLTQTLGRVPTAQEVIDETNDRMASKRADFRRQGMVCTLDDFAYIEVTPASSLDGALETGFEPSIPDPQDHDSPLYSTERLDLIAVTIKRCYEHSEVLGKVAEIWFDPATRDVYDDHPSSADIAPLVGLAPQTCRTKIALVRRYAQEVLKDLYGIEHFGSTPVRG